MLKKNVQNKTNISLFYQELEGQVQKMVSPETCREVYMGILRVIAKNLRKDGYCLLPEFGEMYLVGKKPQVNHKHPTTGQNIPLPGRTDLEFKPFPRIKEYFNNIKHG